MACVHICSPAIAAFSGEEIVQGTCGTAKLGQVWKEKKTEVGISLMGTGSGVGGRGVRRWEPGQVYLNWMDTAPGTLPEPRPPLRPGPFQGLLGTIRAAFRTAWTSRPQVSSLASTGREQSEIGVLAADSLVGEKQISLARQVRAVGNTSRFCVEAKFKAIQILDFSSGVKENCLKIEQISSATQWCSGVPETVLSTGCSIHLKDRSGLLISSLYLMLLPKICFMCGEKRNICTSSCSLP